MRCIRTVRPARRVGYGGRDDCRRPRTTPAPAALPPALQEVVDGFREAPRSLVLELLLEYADAVPPLPPHLADHPELLERVPECQTPFFLKAEVDDDDRTTLWFDAPPEAPTTRAFAGILAAGLDGATADGGAGGAGRLLPRDGARRGDLAASAARDGGDPRAAQAAGARAAVMTQPGAPPVTGRRVPWWVWARRRRALGWPGWPGRWSSCSRATPTTRSSSRRRRPSSRSSAGRSPRRWPPPR